MHGPAAIPQRDHLFRRAPFWNARLGDVLVEPSSEQLAARLERAVAGLSPDLRPPVRARINYCLSARDAAFTAATELQDPWASRAAGGEAELAARTCLSKIGTDIDAATKASPTTTPSDKRESTPVTPKVETVPDAAFSSVAVPVAVGGAIIATVLLLS